MIDYVVFAYHSSYTVETFDTHAARMPATPSVAAVLSRTAYGTYTGTCNSSSSVRVFGSVLR